MPSTFRLFFSHIESEMSKEIHHFGPTVRPIAFDLETPTFTQNAVLHLVQNWRKQRKKTEDKKRQKQIKTLINGNTKAKETAKKKQKHSGEINLNRPAERKWKANNFVIWDSVSVHARPRIAIRFCRGIIHCCTPSRLCILIGMRWILSGLMDFSCFSRLAFGKCQNPRLWRARANVRSLILLHWTSLFTPALSRSLSFFFLSFF